MYGIVKIVIDMFFYVWLNTNYTVFRFKHDDNFRRPPDLIIDAPELDGDEGFNPGDHCAYMGSEMHAVVLWSCHYHEKI